MLELIQIWMRWWKHIAIFCVVAGVLSALVSMPAIMPPYYSARMLFYPANPAASDRAALFREEGTLIDYFGGKEDVNRFLSIANSSALVNFMVDSFQLKQHYDIDDAGSFYVNREFRGNYKAMKNDLGAIEVSIEDQDPVLTAAMVKAAVAYIDQSNRAILKENKEKTLEIFRNDYEKSNQELGVLADSLSKLKKIYPVSYDSEGNLLGDEKVRLLAAQVKNLTKNVNQLSTMINQYQVSLSDNFTTMHVIEEASVPEKKIKPVRWMIVLGTLMGAFVLATLATITIEMFKRAERNAI